MKYVVFENAGEIDERAIWTFGVNVKDASNQNAIGFFGTGLKYAISILLREKQPFCIQSGENTYSFCINPVDIRGKTFDVVCLKRFESWRELGFTLELGKTWKLWQAYRELYCNCADEKGKVYLTEQPPQPAPGLTRVVVSGERFMEQHLNRENIILLGDPVYKSSLVNIHPGESRCIFYRGIKILDLPGEERTRFTYNVLAPVDLTEDRTAKYPVSVMGRIRDCILGATDQQVLRTVVTAKRGSYEYSLNYVESFFPTGQDFLTVVDQEAKLNISNVVDSALKVYKASMMKHAAPTTITLDDHNEAMLREAVEFCKDSGFPVDNFRIFATPDLGEGILGMVYADKIYLSLSTFNSLDNLVRTLIEEWAHLSSGHSDCTREFQEFFLAHIIRLSKHISHLHKKLPSYES